jgi:hypothetical protein
MPVVSPELMPLPVPFEPMTPSTAVHVTALSYTAFVPSDPDDMHLGCSEVGNTPRVYTQQQKRVLGQLQLPITHGCPSPSDCSSDGEGEEHRNKLLETYQSFAMDLHNGMDLMQLSHVKVRCHLLDDLTTLTMDRGNGNIIEFPLGNVTRVFRLVKIGCTWRSADEACSASPCSEQQVVLIFQRRKLAFVFDDKDASEQCM